MYVKEIQKKDKLKQDEIVSEKCTPSAQLLDANALCEKLPTMFSKVDELKI